MFTFLNPKSGKELRLSEQIINEVFDIEGCNRFICLPYKVSQSVKIKKKVKKKIGGTCVIRMGGLGDLILLSSGLRELKGRMKKSPLTFATLKEHVPFIRSLGFLDHVLDVDKINHYGFEKVIDLRFAVEPPQLGSFCKGTWESYMMDDRSDAFDKLLGVYPCPKIFLLHEDDKTEVRMYKIVGNDFILICASMVAAARSIIPSYIKPLCHKILRMGKKVVLIGQSQPWNKNLSEISGDGIINLIDKTSTPELISLCRLADVVVTPDTGTLHIAGALGTKTLGIFGNINPRTRVSYYRNVNTLYPHGKMECIPCGDLHPCKFNNENGTDCIRLSTPSIIMKEIEEFL